MGKYCTAWVTPYIQTCNYEYHNISNDNIDNFLKKMKDEKKVANIDAGYLDYSIIRVETKIKEPIIHKKWNGTCGHSLEPCKCNYSCFYCKRTKVTDCSSDPFNGHEYITQENIRKKFVCLDCNHIWKAYAYEGMRNNKELLIEMGDKHYDIAGLIGGINEKERSIVDGSENSRCNKCRKPGIEVGPTFRHCKNKKEWNLLKEKVLKKEIDLFVDFFFCPSDSKI